MAKRKVPEGGKGPRDVACEVLDRLRRPEARANQELLLRGKSLGDSRDIRLATELVQGTLRNLTSLDKQIEALAGVPLERIDRALLSPLRIGLYQMLHLDRIPSSASVDESVRLARSASGPRGAGFVNAVLRKAARDRENLRLLLPEDLSAAGLSMRYSVPEWIVARWLARRGEEETVALLRTMARPSPLSGWVNPLRATPDSLTGDLAREGIEAQISARIPGSLRILQGNPARSRSFEEGRLYLQDEASQVIALLLPVRSGETVLDLCAAPGGKSFALACRVGPAGRVLCVDRSVSRLRRLLVNRDRLGIPGIVPLAADLERGAPLRRCFGSVLLDAPCTGTGVLGRHPEIRWRRDPADLVALAMRQEILLEKTASLVAPTGGLLLYSVCSLEPEEGEDQINRFLVTHPGFRTLSLREFVPAGLTEAITGEGFFQSLPHRDGTDGFFAALLRREA